MKSMAHIEDLNTAHVLGQLWEKLPKYLRSKWTERGTHLKFTRKPLKRGKRTNLATDVNRKNSNQQTVACSLCKKPHNLNKCEQFLKKSLRDRQDFLVERKLCFGYFSNQHIAKHCKERQM